MRKLILFMHMSLDGYVADTDKRAGWGGEPSPDIFGSVVPRLIRDADTLLLGRVLSDELLGYWLNLEAATPHAPADELAYARWATGTRKVILSRKEEKPQWPNAEIQVVEDGSGMRQAIARLKQAPGRNIVVHGGVRTARDLARLGLVDEYQLVIHPVVLGGGESIFTEVQDRMALKLKGVEALAGGALFATYAPSPAG